jgi:hypothetical protein
MPLYILEKILLVVFLGVALSAVKRLAEPRFLEKKPFSRFEMTEMP